MTETNSLGDGQSRTSTPGAAHHVVPTGDRPSPPMYAAESRPSSAHVVPCRQLAPDPYGNMSARSRSRLVVRQRI